MAVKYLAGNRLTGSNSDRGGFTTTNLLSGSQWLETDTNDIYHWDGSSWDLIAGDTVSQTLTNKTLTSPTIGTSLLMAEDATIIFEGASANDNETILTVVDPTGDRTVSLPNATDTLVGKATTDTLTNKTVVHGSNGNSITGLVNASIANSAGIVNSKLAGPSISVTDGSNSTNIALGSALTFAATSNETTVVNSSGTVTIGIVASPTFSGNVSVSGNLTVSGDTVTHNVGDVVIEDSLLSLASTNSANSIDIGWYGKYIASSTNYWAGMFWDAGTGNFYARTAMTSEPSATWSGGTAAGINAGEVTATDLTISGTSTTIGTVTSGIWNAGAVTSSGAITGASLVADNIILDANTISTSSGDLLLSPTSANVKITRQIVLDDSSDGGGDRRIYAGSTSTAGGGAVLRMLGYSNTTPFIFYTASSTSAGEGSGSDVIRLKLPGGAATTGTVAWENINVMSIDQAATLKTTTGVLTIDGDDGLTLQSNSSNVSVKDDLVLGTGSSADISDVFNSVNDGGMRISGGSAASTGAHIALYGGSHASVSNDAYIDADNFKLRAQNGSTTYLTVDMEGSGAGSVGIGTAAPAANTSLHIYDSGSNSSNLLRLENNDASSTAAPYWDFRHNDDGQFVIWRGTSSTFMNFSPAGNVLIGHTAAVLPAGASPAFQIIGTDQNSSSFGMARYKAGAEGPQFFFAKSDSDTKGTNVFPDDGDSAGSIHWQAADSTDNDLGIEVAKIAVAYDGDVTQNSGSAYMTFSTTNAGNASTERMRIDKAGKVGIGVAPSHNLTVYGTSGETQLAVQSRGGTDASVIIDADDGDDSKVLFANEGTNYWVMGNDNGASDSFMIADGGDITSNIRFTILDSSGNVGIGIPVPLDKLHVDGGDLRVSNSANQFTEILKTAEIRFQDSSATNGAVIGQITAANRYFGHDTRLAEIEFRNSATYEHGGMDIAFRTDESDDGAHAMSDRMVIANTGNVGIGTTTPDQKLEVAGALKLSGNDATPILVTKSTVDHQMTNVIADTTVYGMTTYADGNGGGLLIRGLSDDDNLYSALALEGYLGGAAQTGKGGGSTGNGVIRLMANVHEGGTANATEVGVNGNLVSIDNNNSVRFIFDSDGEGHADDDWLTYSDNRLKKNQEPVPYGLDEILQLTPKIYTRYSGALDNGEVTLTEKAADIRKQIGFIAQEVKAIIPEIVRDVDETEAFYSLNDGKIMAVAVKAIQELSTKVNALDSRITVLESA